MEENIISVTELNEHIKNLVDSDGTLSRLCVRGELSNYKVYPSGHHYFTLKDKAASVRCVMFKSAAQRLVFRPESGMSVLCTGSVSVYPRDGAYQLYVSRMSPEGIGDLYLAYEQLKERLAAEGLFDSQRKQRLPAYPGTIAVITSGAGAAVRDIIRVLGKRWPMSKVVILPVRVQGKEAPAEITGAIRYANRYHVADLIITGRGGGSIEDLWAFNDERVVRSIANSAIPVISAVGHEPDVTISDFAADVRAATPSNGAELAVPDQNEVREKLASLKKRLDQELLLRIRQKWQQLKQLAARRVMEDPVSSVDQRRLLTDALSRRLLLAQEGRLRSAGERLGRLCASLDALSPMRVLARGYSVVRTAGGSVISDAALLSPGEMIEIKMERGSADCRVENIRADSPEERTETII